MNERLPYRVLEDFDAPSDREDVRPHMELIRAVAENRVEPLDAARKMTNTVVEQGAEAKAEIDRSGTNELHPRVAEVIGMAIASTASSCPPPAQEQLF